MNGRWKPVSYNVSFQNKKEQVRKKKDKTTQFHSTGGKETVFGS